MSMPRYNPRVGEVVGYPGARRDSMTGLEIQQARAIKARLRCGWQVVGDMMGRTAADVQRACEGGTSSVTARVGVVAPLGKSGARAEFAPVGRSRSAEATAPEPRRITPAEVKNGEAVLCAMLEAVALPGFCPRPTHVIAKLAELTPPQTGVVLRDLRACTPPVIAALGSSGPNRTWRLTDAGVAWAKGFRL